MRHIPIFVVGPARSGITALAGALAAATGWPQHHASRALGMVDLLRSATRSHAVSLRLGGLSPQGAALSPRVAEALLKDVLAGAEPGTGAVLRAADTLPGFSPLAGLRHVLPSLPDARVVFLRRAGVDTIASRLRRLPGMDFANHCVSWATAMEAGSLLRDAFPDRVLTVDCAEIQAAPEAVAGRAAAFCGLDEATAGRCAAYLRQQRPGRTSLDPAAPPLTLASVGWSAPEKLLFAEICGAAMAGSGLPCDAEAALRRAPLRLADLAAGHAVRVDGLEISAHPEKNRLRLRPSGQSAGIAVFHTVAAVGRSRISGRLHAGGGSEAPVRVRLEIVGTLSRQPVLVREWRIPPRHAEDLSEALQAVPDMVDLVFSVSADGPDATREEGVELCGFTLS